MTRGRKPESAIADAKKFAERMGYHWMENAEPDLPFDLLIFKENTVRIVKVRTTLNRLGPEDFYEKKFPDDVAALCSLPFPQGIIRELWLKSRGERAWCRLHVTTAGVWVIEWWGPDRYTNPHARREIKEKPGPTGKFIVKKSAGPRIIIPPAELPGSEAEK
ncbi:MAG: hypothetical protein A4E35_01543 [Methanoregula sp. PtaU1.Bin051]|nr:MAG: hypothetical protein A4E35_01543 [Methanoregula sp. PtaU1.Bin051]